VANVTGTIASAPIATFGGTATGVANQGRIAASLTGTALLVGTLSLWTFGTVAAAPIATFGGSAVGEVLDGRIAATIGGSGTVSGTLNLYVIGTVPSAPIATFGGSAAGVVFDGRLAAALAGSVAIEAHLRDALDGATLGAIPAAPIATFGGTAAGDVFDGRIAASLAGSGALTGALSIPRIAVIPSGPIATFGGTAAGIIFDGRIAAALAGSGALTGTLSIPIVGLIPSGPIATFGGSAAAIVTDGAIGNILPAPIATFGGALTGYSFDVRVRGSGSGRTHLFLGQIDTANPPASYAGDLYVLTAGYGNPEGTATGLVIETPDIAPLGELGRLRARLASLTLQYEAACTVRVTPIVDYDTELASVSQTLPAPGQVTRTTIPVRMMRALTVLRFRIEVTGGEGPVEIYTPVLFYTPLAERSGVAMGERP
jgi:hypothetical protein